MKVTNLQRAYYSLYIDDLTGELQLFLPICLKGNGNSRRLDLFESKEIALRWIKQEQDAFKRKERWGMYDIYKRLTPKKMFITQFSKVMEENTHIEALTIRNTEYI